MAKEDDELSFLGEPAHFSAANVLLVSGSVDSTWTTKKNRQPPLIIHFLPWGNTAKMGMYIGHEMNEQIDFNQVGGLSREKWFDTHAVQVLLGDKFTQV